MSAHKALSVKLQDIAGSIQHDLLRATGENCAFVLLVNIDDVTQYVSNCDRKDGTELIESLLARWKAGRADIPAHYNPDLRRPDGQ